MSSVLVLRPEPGASETLRRARELGLDALAVPLFEIEPVEWKAPDAAAFDGLLLTSANAVRCAGEQLGALRGLRTYAVGKATAEEARAAGFDIASSGDAGVDRLLGSIDPDIKLLHLCGQDRAEPSDAPQRITAIAVYRARPVQAPDLSRAVGSIALLHSPRAARRFRELAVEQSLDRSTIAVAAISQAALDEAGSGWAAAEAAPRPNDEELLALAARLCDTPARG